MNRRVDWVTKLCQQGKRYFGMPLVRFKPIEDPVKKSWPTPAFHPNSRIWVPNETSERTLIVRGVWYHVGSDEVEHAFAPCGPVDKIIRPRDLATGRLRKYCYVQFQDKQSINEALRMANPVIDDMILQRKRSEGFALRIPKVLRDTPGPRPPYCRTIFVAKINRTNPQVDDDELFDYFEEKIGGVVNAIVIKQLYTGKSRGFGYVEFNNTKRVEEALALSGDSWHNRKIWVDYSTGFPHHLARRRFRIRSHDNIQPSLSEDYYVGTRSPSLPWPNKPFEKYGHDRPIKQHAMRKWGNSANKFC